LNTSTPDNVHLDKPWLSISWDRERKCVYAEFKAFATSSEFRTGTMRILDAIRERHSSALISDNRRLEGVENADQLWIRDDWVPMAVAAGLKRIAVVVAKQGLGRIASEEILSEIGDAKFATRTFTSLDDARKWVAA
jgi:hypothetical protein